MNLLFKNKIIVCLILLFLLLVTVRFFYTSNLVAQENFHICHLDYPLDKSLLVNRDPLLVVKKTFCNALPELLHIQLSHDKDFSNPVIDEKIKATWQYEVRPQLLEYGKKYFWHARIRPAGKEWSKWSDSFQFKINYREKNKRQRGLTEDEIETLKSSSKLKQVLKGYFPEDINISWDGKWLTFYEHTRDICNNRIYIMPTNGSHLRLVPAPYGYKSFPRLIENFLYVNYRPPTGVKKGKGIKKRGVYKFNLKNPDNGWIFVARNYIKYLRTNQPWNFNFFRQDEKIKINMFYKLGDRSKKYPVFIDLLGKYRKIILDSQKENLFAFAILNKKLSKYDTDFAIYHSANHENSLSNLLLPGAVDPSIGLAYDVKHILLYTKIKPRTRHIYAYNLDNRKTYLAVNSTASINCRQPVFNPASNKFYFHAQLGTSAYGIFETSFKLNNLHEQSKKEEILEKINYYLNNNYNWEKAFFYLATNHNLFNKTTYLKIRAQIDKVEKKSKRMHLNYKKDLARPVDDVKPEMLLVKGGIYKSGNREVQVNNFYIDKYEVTNKDIVFIYNWALEHQLFYLKKGSVFFKGKKVLDVSTRYVHLYVRFDRGRFFVSDKYKNQPVIQITWKEAALVCNLFSLLHGYNPCYEMHSFNYNDAENPGYRLPTEAEWEYAARGGRKSKKYIYAGGNRADRVAWYVGNFYGKQPSVGLRIPNELGIYDMSGSVWEWCDCGNKSSKNINELQPVRGGSWTSEKKDITLSARYLFKINGFSHDLGFRMIRPAE